MKKETGEITVGDKTFEATMVTLESDLQKKDVTITENKTTKIEADSEYDGLKEVNVTTNVQGGIDPSGANAQPSDVAYGKTFYAGNEMEKTGTLEEYAGATNITTNGMLATKDKIMRDNLTINVGTPSQLSTFGVAWGSSSAKFALSSIEHKLDTAPARTKTNSTIKYKTTFTVNSTTLTNPRVYLSNGQRALSGLAALTICQVDYPSYMWLYIENDVEYEVVGAMHGYDIDNNRLFVTLSMYDMSTFTPIRRTFYSGDSFILYSTQNGNYINHITGSDLKVSAVVCSSHTSISNYCSTSTETLSEPFTRSVTRPIIENCIEYWQIENTTLVFMSSTSQFEIIWGSRGLFQVSASSYLSKPVNID